MRILFLTSRLPFPPNRGDRLRTYQLLRHASRDHAITLVSFVASEQEAQLARELDAYCEELHFIVQPVRRSQIGTMANFWRRQPLQALYYRSGKMRRLVDELLANGRYDAAYVHLFRMAPYMTGRPDLYRIVDLTDMISAEIAASLPYRSPLSRLIYRLELQRISRYEQEVAGWAEETWLISERDRSELAASRPAANLQVVPNGVDLAHFYPLGQEPVNNRLLFVGHLDVFHNIDAGNYLLDELFPRLRKRIPDCTLDIVGPGEGLQLVGQEPDQGVRLRGFVPDLNEVLNESAVFVAPLRFSAGVQNKVLEAMAAGVPVVTTGNVSAGLAAQAGRDLLVGSGADELVAAVVKLLEDQPLRRQIGQAGRQFIAERFSWQVAMDRLQSVERQLASNES